MNVNRTEIELNQSDRLNNLNAPASHFLKFLCQPSIGTFAKPHKPTHSPSFTKEPNPKDAGSLLQKALALGVGYQPNPGNNLLSFGYSWGQTNETTFGIANDQHTFELFYRLQLSKRLAITPDMQFIVNQALNNQQKSLFLYGIRGRVAL